MVKGMARATENVEPSRPKKINVTKDTAMTACKTERPVLATELDVKLAASKTVSSRYPCGKCTSAKVARTSLATATELVPEAWRTSTSTADSPLKRV